MMNDRFSAGLRQHLLDTANERPAEGQLTAIVEGVAITGQRPPLVARLAWFPGRIGPFPSTAVRLALIAAALLAATMAVALIGGGGGPSRSTVFEGTWTSTDPADDSRMTLVVAAGMTPAVHFEDGFAAGAVCVDDPVKVFTADGTGHVSGSLLAVTYPDGGGCGLMTVKIGPGVFDYDEATDTMLASDRLTWVRVQEGSTLPTQPPAQEESMAPPSIEPAQITGCLEIPGGEYGFDIGGVVALVTLSDQWHAVDHGFHHLEDGACGSSGSMRLDLGLVTEVYTDICHWMGTGVALGDPATTTAFSAQQGFDIADPTETTIAGYPAVRFAFSVPADFDFNACDSQTFRLWGEGPAIDPGLSVTVLLLQVDGVPIGVAATRNADAAPTQLAELDAIVASLRIEP